jgi:hypothetical protein
VLIADYSIRNRNVQLGLIRRPEIDHRLRGYISYAAPNSHYREFPISDGPHSLAIARDGDRYSFEVDGQARPDVVTLSMAQPYPQVGAQVSDHSDAISGVVTQAATGARGALEPVSFSDACSYHNRGLEFVQRGEELVATGTYQPDLRAAYQGDCSAFYAQKTAAGEARSNP